MGYKAIFTADWHLSNRLPHSVVVGNGETDRLRQQIRVVDDIYAAAVEHKANAIFVLGDVFDRSLVDAVTLTAATQVVSRTPVPLYILPGNHDASSVKGDRFTVEAFGAMNNPDIHVVRGCHMLSGINFHAFPFAPVKETAIDMALIREKLPKGLNIALFHNSVLGCDHLEWTCDDGLDPDEMCEGFDFVIGGHFHQSQQFCDGKGMYVGAPMSHNFGDKNRDAGYWLLDINRKSGKIKKKHISSNAPRFHVVSNMNATVGPVKDGDYLRLEVECTNAEWVQLEPKAKAYGEGLPNLNVTYKHKPVYAHEKRLKKSSVGAKLSLNKAIGEYVDDISPDELDAAELKRIGKEILAGVRSEHGIA